MFMHSSPLRQSALPEDAIATSKLAKVIAQAGVASRRKAEMLIEEGRVQVNGQICRTVATRVDPLHDTVMVDGQPIFEETTKIVLMLHKPRGIVSTVRDPDGKPTVMQFIPKHYAGFRLFPVGRLDEDSEGLLLLTNDGELAYKLTHPKFEVPKTYIARITGHLTPYELERLERGIPLKEKRTEPALVEFVSEDEESQEVRITITEGLHRQVRRMFRALNHEVIRLQRIRFGEHELGDLAAGKCIEISKMDSSNEL